MKFLDPHLDLRTLADGRHFQVLTEFDYHIGSPDGTSIVRCKPGMITDFCSNARVFWNILPPMGRYGPACAVHDELYQSGVVWDTLTNLCAPISRAYADGVLREACRVLAANEMLTFGARETEFADYLDRTILYWGVRLFGWRTWNDYRRREQDPLGGH